MDTPSGEFQLQWFFLGEAHQGQQKGHSQLCSTGHWWCSFCTDLFIWCWHCFLSVVFHEHVWIPLTAVFVQIHQKIVFNNTKLKTCTTPSQISCPLNTDCLFVHCCWTTTEQQQSKCAQKTSIWQFIPASGQWCVTLHMPKISLFPCKMTQNHIWSNQPHSTASCWCFLTWSMHVCNLIWPQGQLLIGRTTTRRLANWQSRASSCSSCARTLPGDFCSFLLTTGDEPTCMVLNIPSTRVLAS